MASEKRASAGSVGVDVVPQAAGFFQKFQADTRAQADKAGKEIGKAIASQIVSQITAAFTDGVTAGGRKAQAVGTKVGKQLGGTVGEQLTKSIATSLTDGVTKGGKDSLGASTKVGQEIAKAIAAPIAKTIKDGITDGVDGGGRESAPKGERDGQNYGGRFGEAVRRRLAEALKALPKAQIDGDATPAERRIEELRAELTSLRGAKIGVDVSEADAIAKLRALRVELDQIGSRSPSVRIQVNAGAAAAEIAALEVELQGVGDKSTTSASSISAMTAAIVGLGPAAIPVLAAVVAGIAGIGAAIVGGAAGIGVLGLGFAGIGGAVSALSDQQTNATKTAASYASAQSQVASAADQVKSAEASVGQAVASAADAQVRAEEAVQGAEQQLANAQRQAQDAQRALTAARVDAKRALEDMDNQVKDGALAQRQATVDQIQAKYDLDAVLLNPVSNVLQREQAQITYQEAIQHLTEITTQNQRLAVDKAAADKLGVEGSQQVYAAQVQVQQANQGVADAQQHVADAIREQTAQQRQAAFSIAQAQQGVISAQRQLQQATVSAGTAGAESMTALQKAMAGLSPVGQDFARFLFGLKPVLTDLRATAQDGLLPGVESGILRVLPLLPQVKGLVADVSGTVGQLFDRAGRELTSPIWGQFFGFVRSEASPSLQEMADVAFSLGRGIAGVLIAFKPVEDQVLSGVVRLARGFADWGASAGQNSDVQQFIRYVQQKGPEVGRTIFAIAGAVGQVGIAAAPIGGVVLTGIRLFATVVGAIPVPVLTALAAVIIPVVVGIKAWDLASAGLAKTQTFFTGVAELATKSTERFGGVVGTVSTKVGSAATSVAGFASAFGGPLVIGLTVATTLIGLFIQQAAEQKAKVDGLKTSLLGLADSYNSSSDSSAGMLKNLVQNDENFRKMIKDSAALGINLDTISAAVHGNGEALNNANAAYDQQIAHLQTLRGPQGNYQAGVLDNIRALQAQKAALSGAVQTVKDQADALTIINGKQGEVSASGDRLAGTDLTLYRRLKDLAAGTLSASDAAGVLKDSYDKLFGVAQSQDQATETYSADIQHLTDAIKTNGDAFGDNTDAARANKDAFRALLQQSKTLYDLDIANGVPEEQAIKRANDRVQALQALAKGAGFNADAVEAMIRVYGQTPDTITTQLTILGYGDALGQLNAVGLAAKKLVDTYGISADVAAALASGGSGAAAAERQLQAIRQQQRNQNEAGFAEGGLVTGPGTGTSDSILARVSNTEFIQPAATVAHYGVPFMEALRTRSMPKFSAGGLVGPSVNTSFSSNLAEWPAFKLYNIGAQEILGTLKSLTQQGTATPTAGGGGFSGSGSVSRWAPQVANVLSLLGQPQSLSGAVLRRINFESGGDPYAVNREDSNWLAGHPSVGLAQVIQGTFAEYAGQFAGTGPFNYGVSEDPTANIYAGMRYALHRYGSINAIDPLVRPYGYDAGGYLPPGISTVVNATGRPEPVLTDSQWDHVQKAAGGAAGGITIRAIVQDGQVQDLIRLEVDDAWGSLADAHVYNTAG